MKSLFYLFLICESESLIFPNSRGFWRIVPVVIIHNETNEGNEKVWDRFTTKQTKETKNIAGMKGAHLILYKALCDLIIKTAIDVQRELGAGFLEKVYENAMVVALEELAYNVEQQKKIEVWFRNHLVGEYYADIVVENKIILELKAIENLHPSHNAQLLNYLKASDFEVGYVINFGKIPLQFKRLVMMNDSQRKSVGLIHN